MLSIRKGEITEWVNRFLAGPHVADARSFHLCTTYAVAEQPELLHEWKKTAIRLAKHGIKPQLWNYEQLQILLHRRRDIVSELFGDVVADGYCHRNEPLALGNADDVSLAKAREAASEERARIASGADPRVAIMEREAEQAAQREALIAAEIRRKREASTLSDMFDAWLENGVQRSDGNAELRRTFDKDILSRLGNKPVRGITDVELRDALRKVGRSRGRGRTAERMLSEIRQMYRWAIKRQPWKALLSEGNPAVTLPLIDVSLNRDRYPPTS